MKHMFILFFPSAKRLKIKAKIMGFDPVWTSGWRGPGIKHIMFFDGVFVLALIAG